MSTHRRFDRICCAVLAFTLVLTLVFINGERLGLQKASTVMGYETALFDTTKVHTINIIMDDWGGFLEACTSEEYYPCTVVIDHEAYKNVAIRGKGNTSLTQVAAYGNNRYSFKIEFDHYDNAKTYHGLDKLCLNNMIQDNTYMKDYLTYEMMRKAGVAAPLCSYVNVTVNGESWGLYLAVEGVEESFLKRNFGKDYGALYKPDSATMGGGRGNGGQFDMEEFQNPGEKDGSQDMPFGQGGQMPEKMLGGANASEDVLLQYIDDSFDSYANIFGNAKTDIADTDKTRLIEALKALGGDMPDSAVNAEAVIRYFVVHNFVLNFDSYTGSMVHNYYLYESDGQMQMIPWDYNLAFGGFVSSESAESLVNYPIDTPVSGGSIEDRPMLAWILESAEYTALYHEIFAQFLSSCFDSGYFGEMIDSVNALISPYVEADSTKFCTYEEFEAGISTLKDFCLLRAESIRGQLDGSIGSTADAQETGDLIDPGDIQISQMGSMDNMGGGMPNVPMENGGMPQMPWENTGEGNGNISDAMPGSPNGNTQGEAPPELPEGNMQGETPPELPNKNTLGETPPELPWKNTQGEAPPKSPNENTSGETPLELPGENIQGETLPEETTPDETPPQLPGGMPENSQPDFPGQGPDGSEMPGRPGGAAPDTQSGPTVPSSEAWILVTVCAGVLSLGIGFALLYQRRKH